MSGSGENESILNNLSKTRQLWNSKADLGTPSYLIPKSPLSPSANQPKQQLTNGNSSVPAEVVRADEQVVEDYKLPDIKSVRSQWEVPQNTACVPLPSAKSPAVLAREKSMKREQNEKLPEPVNRNVSESNDDVYEVELTKLKAQFESAARASNKPRPKSPKTPAQNKAIKEQITRSPSSKQVAAGNSYKKLRFEDEMNASDESYVTEQRTESSSLLVDLTGIKSQFESRKDENLVTPKLSHRKTPEKSGFDRISSAMSTSQTSNQEDTSSHRDDGTAQRDEPVKSSEPVYDEMVGEESVKDRLKRYKSMTESVATPKPTIIRRTSRREVTTVVKDSEPERNEVFATQDIEVVRSPPAGTRETPEYVGSVDLRQAKALFENPEPKPSKRTLTKSSSSLTSPTATSPVRRGRSSISSSSQPSRSSSQHSATSSRSPSSKRSKSPAPSFSTTTSSISVTVEDSMAEVVKPLPAGTKETPDYVPAVKVSSMKNMFETPESKSPVPVPTSSPRRQPEKKEWVKDDQANNEHDEEVDNEDVVRPSSAGAKELPDYNLSADFLKSRAAIFNAAPPKQYTPRNKVSVSTDNTQREVVNAQPEELDVDYELSQSLQDTKKMFEKGGPIVSPRPSTRKQTPSQTQEPPAEVVRPPPAGTRLDDVIPAADIRSAKSLFEKKQEVVEDGSRKKPIDIRSEVVEAQRREKEVISKQSVAHEEKADDVNEGETSGIAEAESEDDAPELVGGGGGSERNELQEPMSKVKTDGDEVPSESESESEGEYVVQKREEPGQIADDAAAIVPVRVALPDVTSESTSSDDSSEVEEKDVEVKSSELLMDEADEEEESEEKETSHSEVDGGMRGDEQFVLEAQEPQSLLTGSGDMLVTTAPAASLLDSTSSGTGEPVSNGNVSLLDTSQEDFSFFQQDLVNPSPTKPVDTSLLQTYTNLVDTPLLETSSSKPTESLLEPLTPASDPPLLAKSGDVDLLNGFTDSPNDDPSKSTPLSQLESTGQSQLSQPLDFDLFISSPPPNDAPPQDTNPKDPFDLFM